MRGRGGTAPGRARKDERANRASAMDYMHHQVGGLDNGKRRPATNTGWHHPMSANFAMASTSSSSNASSSSHSPGAITEGVPDQHVFGRLSYPSSGRGTSTSIDASAPHRSAPSSSYTTVNSSSSASRRRRRSAKSRSSSRNIDEWAFSSSSDNSMRSSGSRASSAPRWREGDPIESSRRLPDRHSGASDIEPATDSPPGTSSFATTTWRASSGDAIHSRGMSSGPKQSKRVASPPHDRSFHMSSSQIVGKRNLSQTSYRRKLGRSRGVGSTGAGFEAGQGSAVSTGRSLTSPLSKTRPSKSGSSGTSKGDVSKGISDREKRLTEQLRRALDSATSERIETDARVFASEGIRKSAKGKAKSDSSRSKKKQADIESTSESFRAEADKARKLNQQLKEAIGISFDVGEEAAKSDGSPKHAGKSISSSLSDSQKGPSRGDKSKGGPAGHQKYNYRKNYNPDAMKGSVSQQDLAVREKQRQKKRRPLGRAGSAKITRGYLSKEKGRKRRNQSADIITRRRAAQRRHWENMQRPPSRQRSPFPTHLAEFEFRRYNAFGAGTEPKQAPQDPVARKQIANARKVAEESPRPPSRHRPPSQNLFLEVPKEKRGRSKDLGDLHIESAAADAASVRPAEGLDMGDPAGFGHSGEMQDLYDLTLQPAKEHPIPIQITTRDADGGHAITTTNTVEVSKGFKSRMEQGRGKGSAEGTQENAIDSTEDDSAVNKMMMSLSLSRLDDAGIAAANEVARKAASEYDAAVAASRTTPRREYAKSQARLNISAMLSARMAVAKEDDSADEEGEMRNRGESRLQGHHVDQEPLASDTIANDHQHGERWRRKEGKDDVLDGRGHPNLKESAIGSMDRAESLSAESRARTAGTVNAHVQGGLGFGGYRPPLTAYSPATTTASKAGSAVNIAGGKATSPPLPTPTDERPPSSRGYRGQRNGSRSKASRPNGKARHSRGPRVQREVRLANDELKVWEREMAKKRRNDSNSNGLARGWGNGSRDIIHGGGSGNSNSGSRRARRDSSGSDYSMEDTQRSSSDEEDWFEELFGGRDEGGTPSSSDSEMSHDSFESDGQHHLRRLRSRRSSMDEDDVSVASISTDEDANIDSCEVESYGTDDEEGLNITGDDLGESTEQDSPVDGIVTSSGGTNGDRNLNSTLGTDFLGLFAQKQGGSRGGEPSTFSSVGLGGGSTSDMYTGARPASVGITGINTAMDGVSGGKGPGLESTPHTV